jgi:hypothetical protein
MLILNEHPECYQKDDHEKQESEAGATVGKINLEPASEADDEVAFPWYIPPNPSIKRITHFLAGDYMAMYRCTYRA